MKISKNVVKTLIVTLAAFGCVASGKAATATLLSNDPLNISSFTVTTNWAFVGTPDTFTNYFTSTNQLRTPPTATDAVFPGASLTLQGKLPGDANGSMIDKSSATNGAGRNLIINNLTNGPGAVIRSGGNPGSIMTITGNVFAVVGSSTLKADQCSWHIASPMVGPEGVILTNAITTNSGAFEQHITYTNDNSNYKGKLFITANANNISAAVFFATLTSALGNPSVLTPDQITLGVNGYIRDEVGVTFGANSGITLATSTAIFADTPGSNTVIAGPITDNGSGFNLTKRGGGTMTLSGNNTFSGGLTLFGATAGSQLNVNNPGALGTGTFTINGGNNAVMDCTSAGPVVNANNNPETWQNSFAFIGSQSLNLGAGTATMTGSLTVTVSNNNLTVGPVTDNGGGFTLTKAGGGMLTLFGGGFYSGATTVAGGTLKVTGSGASLSSSTFNISSNAILDMSSVGGLFLPGNGVLSDGGTVVGGVTDNFATSIYPGGNNTVGTLTVNGNLTLNGGGGLTFDLSNTDTTSGAGINDLVVVTGTLNFANPTTTISINGVTTNGAYTLFQYGTFAGSLANVSVPIGYVLTNNTGARAIQLIATNVIGSLTWVGDGVGNTWDTGISANWKLGGRSGVVFFTGDSATFDDTGSATPPINLVGSISPQSTIVSASKTYDFTGTGIMTGNLIKNGTGTLILENSNSFAGPTVINGGILQLGNFDEGSLGSGPVTNNGIIVVQGGGGTVANFFGPISGTGAFTNASGDSSMSVSNSYTGLTTISGGRVLARNGFSLGDTNTGTVVTSGGQLYIVANVNFGAEPLTLAGIGDGNGALRKGGAGATIYAGTVTLTDDSTISVDSGASLTLTNATGIVGLNHFLIFNGGGGDTVVGPISLGTGGLTVNGGTLSLNSPDSYSGGTTLAGSVVVVNANTNNVFGTGLISAGGSSGRIVLGTGTALTNHVIAGTLAPGVATGFLMVNDNTNGTVTTISGPLEFDVTAANGGNFLGPITSGYLNVTGPISNTPPGVIVSSRNGFVRFSGHGDYTAFTLNQGTTSIGANNGLSTSAVLSVGPSGNATFDLNGFNQALAGLTDTGSAARLVTNSAASLSTLTLNLSGGYTYNGLIGGNLALTLNGSGSLYLTNSNSYTGNTTVNGGTLELAQPALSALSTVSVASGALLQLDFAVTNQIHGLVLGGVNQPAGVYSSGTSSGFIAGSGFLLVQPVATYPTNIVFSVSGNTLSLSWPATHLGWILQSQTNALTPGLRPANWTDVPGSGSVTQSTITMNPANPTVFFRLRSP
jgi:autotransporter-associated beta strand protein